MGRQGTAPWREYHSICGVTLQTSQYDTHCQLFMHLENKPGPIRPFIGD